jgi:hypothetical protein
MRRAIRFVIGTTAVLFLATTVQALPLSYLIEQERAKIEPATKLFHEKCKDHTDNESCKEDRELLVKALNGFVSMVQKELALLDPNAGDADFKKQTAERRTRMQQELQWAQEQLKMVNQVVPKVG